MVLLVKGRTFTSGIYVFVKKSPTSKYPDVFMKCKNQILTETGDT